MDQTREKGLRASYASSHHSKRKKKLMDESEVFSNADTIVNEIQWLVKILNQRLKELNSVTLLTTQLAKEDKASESSERYGELLAQQQQSSEGTNILNYLNFEEVTPPEINEIDGPYASLIKRYDLNATDRILLIVGFLPHFAPAVLSQRLVEKKTRLFTTNTYVGGYVDKLFGNFVPSLQTALFLLSGMESKKTALYSVFFKEESVLLQEQVVILSPTFASEDDTNILNHVPAIAPEFLGYLLSGNEPRPDFGKNFPATLVETGLEWDDLVLEEISSRGIKSIDRWMSHGRDLIELDSAKINPSFPCLFYGSPGTGKTLCATLIGKKFGMPVFKIDLSMVVSKYIGETEKNLALLFDRAEGKNWVLFFDEADALFGKRTDINQSQDKWANLEMSYLLQRLETYDGLTILSTNFKNNLDKALTRRFKAIVKFPRPSFTTRKILWKKRLPNSFQYDSQISYDKLAKYDLTGANISNILQAACLAAMSNNSKIINQEVLSEAILAELAKEDRTL